MKRSMSRQAEAERERRARIISADGEYQASKRLAMAANVMARDPAALQLRLLQTVVEVAAEKNSTLVMPVPVELLRFFERYAPAPPAQDMGPPPVDTGEAELAQAEAGAEIGSAPVPPPAIADVPVPEIPKAPIPELDESVVPPVPDEAGDLADEPKPGATSADASAGDTAGDTAGSPDGRKRPPRSSRGG
jgi:hypothetical protein